MLRPYHRLNTVGAAVVAMLKDENEDVSEAAVEAGAAASFPDCEVVERRACACPRCRVKAMRRADYCRDRCAARAG